MRDRQAERVPEQRRHREPVGDRADHRGLGPGVDEPEHAVLAERGDVDDGGQQQQRRPRPCASCAARGGARVGRRSAAGRGGGPRGIGRTAGARDTSPPDPKASARRPHGPAWNTGPPARPADRAPAADRDHLRHLRRLPRRPPAGHRAGRGPRRPPRRRRLGRRPQPAQEGREPLQPVRAARDRRGPQARPRGLRRGEPGARARLHPAVRRRRPGDGRRLGRALRRVQRHLRGRLPGPHAGHLDHGADREDLRHGPDPRHHRLPYARPSSPRSR